MPQDRVDFINADSRFYQVNYRKLITFSFVLLALAYILLSIVIYQHIIRPTPKYFAATSDGRLIEIRSLYEVQEENAAANTNTSSSDNTTTPASP
jgi:hypothetical protein